MGKCIGWIFARDLDAGDVKVVEQRRNLTGIKVELEKQLGLCMHPRVLGGRVSPLVGKEQKGAYTGNQDQCGVVRQSECVRFECVGWNVNQ